MSTQDPTPAPKPPRVTGSAHVLAAAGYSFAGLRRLWRETAFRHEAMALVCALALFAATRASLAEFCILLALFLLLVAVEALNTAIECIVDRLSPTWEEYARDAKDLGSLAVMCILFTGGIFICYVVAGRFFGL